jgi:glycosyltransferase involved in cell wall biosynthesis
MKKALAVAGVEIVESADEPFDIAVHIVTPNLFRPIRGAINLLFTMFETTSIPESWTAPLKNADILVVPCRNNRDLFKQYYKGPIEICREGIDPLAFTFHERKRPSATEPFRFLWVGAPNPRKGYDMLPQVWSSWLKSSKIPTNIQLYMKTTGTSEDSVVNHKMAYLNRNGSYRMGFVDARDLPDSAPSLPNVIIDYRNISQEELIGLYNSSHAFILPSTGEGWGLTLCEAMATGLPCIWTHWGGPRDYADETVGYPLKQLSLVPVDMKEPRINSDGDPELVTVHKSYGAMSMVMETKNIDGMPFAKIDQRGIIRRCEQIYSDYSRALSLGKKASIRMHTRYKWSDAAEEFIAICRKYAK